MAIFELSSKKYKNGRRPFTAILYELQPPECVVEDFGTKYNKNGITFIEEYCAQQLDSIKDMSVTVEFVDENRTQILGHGLTGTEDGMPTFDNATVIGHFTEGYISDVQINEETKRVVMGKGYLDEMRYHAFIEGLESDLKNGNSIEGSIEIYKSDGNDGIVYKKGGYPDQGRIPTQFIHSGWSMVLNPADATSTLIELNSKNKQEDEKNMEFDMNEVKAVIQSTITELNSKETDFNNKVAELNQVIAEKDATISEQNEKIVELNATIEQVQKALDDLKKEHETYWVERDALEKELGELKAKARIGELNSAIEGFSEDEKKFAESEINAFNENPMNGNVDAIVSKIYVEIGKASKKAADDTKIAEQNSVNEIVVEDIFSEMCAEVHIDEEEDLNIF